MKNKILIIIFLNIFFIKSIYPQEKFFSDSNSKEHKSSESDRIKSKIKEAKNLVSNAVNHFLKVKIEQACYDFIYNPVWRKGELYVFVIGEKGNCLAQGDDSNLIWKNVSKVKSIEGFSLLKQMLKSTKGRFLGYIWDKSYMTSYVKTVKKDGKRYILGAGFFPQNHEYTTKTIVQSAVAFFYPHDKDLTFSLISQPYGPFVKGDIYSYVYDFDGFCVAHGKNPAFVGQNLIDMVDSKGKYPIKEIINVAKEKGKGWVDFIWDNDLKRSYVIKVIDPKTKKPYAFAAGYYPNDSFEAVKTFVHRAVSYLKANGAKNAFPEFSNPVGAFVKGGMAIFVYDLKGKCLAHGYAPGLVGQNLMKRTDQHGKYYVKEIIRIAKKYKEGIATYHAHNAFTMAYVVEIQTPDGKFVLGCKYIPESKIRAVEGFVNKAIDFLENNDLYTSLARFSSKKGGFVQGDLSIFVYNAKGIRLVNGFKKGQIWRNFSKSTDQNGKAVIEDIIPLALNGGGWYQYKALNSQRKVYVKPLEKDNHTYIVGSGFFL